jgi:YidC/Oxa1 family membrane protein insertase
MGTWTLVVDLLRGLLFSVAHLFGGSLGSSILVVSVLIRIALLPLTIKAARAALEQQKRMKKLAPALEKLRKRYRDNPQQLALETRAVYEKHGVELMPRGMVSSMAMQLPVNAALYQAVVKGVGRGASFLWIGDLARPDVLVASAAALLAGGMAAATVGSPSNRWGIAISTGVTLFLTWRLAAGLGLYWVASNTVGLGQALWIRQTSKRAIS